MGKYMLKVIAFFYIIAVTTSQATFLIHPVGGVLGAVAAGKVVFKGAIVGAAAGAIGGGLAAAKAVQEHLDHFWKKKLGSDTQMPPAIKKCMNEKLNVEGGVQVDLQALIRFKSYLHPKTTNIDLNFTKSFDFSFSKNTHSESQTTVNGGSTKKPCKKCDQDQPKSSSKSFYGPPRSSAIDMANSYTAPVGAPMESGDHSLKESVTSIEDSIASMFFTEADLSLGKKMDVHFTKSTNNAPFLPRDTVEKIPFTLSKFKDILHTFNLKEKDFQANVMKETLKYCEGDKKGDKCCNSLETMVDFATSITGKSVKAISSNVTKDTKMEFKIQGFKKLPTRSEAVTCHKVPFPCAVFYCQKVQKMNVFMTTLTGSDGSNMNVPTLCREDTTSVDHAKWVFKDLKAKAGSCPICHFLLDDDVLWISK